MAKKMTDSLMDLIAIMDPVPARRSPAWHEKLMENDRPRYDELIAVMKDFAAGGVVSRKLTNASNLHRFLVEKKVLEGVSYQQFYSFLSSLKD
jgi:hypothetical protein